MLAQISPDMVRGLSTWVVCAGAVLFLINQGMELVRKIKGRPAKPPNEQLHESHRELSRRVDGIEHDLAQMRREMKEDYAANQAHASARSRTLFDAVAESRKELRAEIQSVRDSVTELQTNMPNQLVSLLKNTGAI
jgi:septation ring formation regulator EzrA